MALFKKRKQDEATDASGDVSQDGFVDDLDEEERAAEDAELAAELDGEPLATERPPLVRPQGPWDLQDAPEDELERLDLGALRVPIPQDIEVRVELNEEGGVVAATLVHADSMAQMSVFAAPRSEGIWSEVVEEILASITEGGGRGTLGDGAWGSELKADVPAQDEQGQPGVMAARFVGVDGPRWFLRALVTGPAARDDAAYAPLESAMRGVVVVRGSDPMAVRDPLPMALPPEAEQARQQQLADAQAGQPDLSLPERGPEITEVR